MKEQDDCPVQDHQALPEAVAMVQFGMYFTACSGPRATKQDA